MTLEVERISGWVGGDALEQVARLVVAHELRQPPGTSRNSPTISRPCRPIAACAKSSIAVGGGRPAAASRLVL